MGAREKVPTVDVRVGDRVFTPAGELVVTRIDQTLLGTDTYITFVEDSDEQWLKMPLPRDIEIEVERAA